MPRLPVCLALALTTASLSCSLTVARPDACSSDLDCRAGFGWGSTCTDEGFCAAPAPPARCDRTLPEDLFDEPQRYADRIVLGALYDHEVHLDSIQASELAVDAVNGKGGLEGQDFALVVCDYGERETDALSSTEAAAETALWLADGLGVTAILGPRGSSRTKAAFEALGERDVVLISPSATSPELTELDETMPTDDRPGRLWRTVPPDTAQAAVIVADLSARNVANVAVIAQQGSYGDALAALIDSGYEQEGGAVDVITYDPLPFEAIANVAAGDYDEVVFISSDIGDYIAFFDGATSSMQLTTAYDAMGIFLTDAAFNEDLLQDVSMDAQVLLDNVRGSRPAPAEGPLYQAFVAAYGAVFGEDPEASGFTVHSYDAAWLIFAAHAWARFNEDDDGGRSLARGLRKMSAGAPASLTESGWATVLDAFAEGTSVNVAGGSGELDYDPATEETTAPIQIWGIDEPTPGEFEFVTIETIP